MDQLEAAWKKREPWMSQGALRLFHGPGECRGELRSIAIDRFPSDHGDLYWITEWETGTVAPPLGQISEFLRGKKALAAAALLRPKSGELSQPELLFSNVSSLDLNSRFTSWEGKGKFRIQLLGARHPGLFLDHQPLRVWLNENSSGLRVLNTFAYTGSLSVAAGLGGAAHVTTLDLSKATIDWAAENWALNGLSADRARFIYGDYFEWIPRLRKQGAMYDCVILDPPSFSRGKNGTFSTSKDLVRLHDLAFSVLSPGGVLVSSINSANVARKRFESEVAEAARARGLRVNVIEKIALPETFPGEDYLKGLIARISSGSGSS